MIFEPEENSAFLQYTSQVQASPREGPENDNVIIGGFLSYTLSDVECRLVRSYTHMGRKVSTGPALILCLR